MELPAILSAQKTDGPSLLEDELTEADGATPGDLPKLGAEDIVTILEGYRAEAEFARMAGPTSRDLTWLQHLDLYHNRWDFSRKASWQAREVMPEFPQYVDRFAAAMRMALVAQPQFFTVTADNDTEGQLAFQIRKFMEVQLRRIGRNATGHRCDFSAIFEEAMKMGALSLPVLKVTYKKDRGDKYGYTGLEVIDPYNWWFDPTGRNLYRIHREELDLHELRTMMAQKDDNDEFLFDQEACNSALQEGSADQAKFRAEKEKRTGTGQWLMSNRKPIIVDEYLCDLIDFEGNIRARNVLCMVANRTHLIRGPEKNPFWHDKDFAVASAIITVPNAPYGRAYAENFAQLTRTFNEFTNLMLDAVTASSMKIFGIVPGYLEDPSQVDDGAFPNMLLRFIEGVENEKAFTAIDMGNLPPEAFQIWQMLKKELQEGAAFNDMTLGNSAPKGRTSATEINQVSDNSSSYMRAIANNVETLLLEPVLDLIWKTGLQFLTKDDQEVQQALGPQWFATFLKRRKELIDYKITFVCRGITSLLARKQKLQDFLQFLQICTANPQMSQVLTSTWPPGKLFAYLCMLMDVDVNQLEGTPMEMQQLKQQQGQQMQQEQQTEVQKAHIAAQPKVEEIGAKAKADIAVNAAKEDAVSKRELRGKIADHLIAKKEQEEAERKGMLKQVMMAQHGVNPEAPQPQAPAGQAGAAQGAGGGSALVGEG